MIFMIQLHMNIMPCTHAQSPLPCTTFLKKSMPKTNGPAYRSQKQTTLGKGFVEQV